MGTEQAKIYQHHTPRQYLLPWADSDERVAWYGYGKVMRSGLTVVGGEDNFYKLKELTVPDVDCMKLFIDGLPEWGRKGHKRFLQMYVLPTRLKRHLEKRGDCGPDAMKLVDVVRSNFMENYHASIERGFWPYLDLIKARDFSFIEDLNKAIEFFHGFSVQYMRTKAVTRPVFKGGTCLKKCYFETYRFSEDLDFTLVDAAQLNSDFLRETFRDVAIWVPSGKGS